MRPPAGLVLGTIIERLEYAYRLGAPEREVWKLVEGMGFDPNDIAAAVLRESAVASAQAERRRRVRPIDDDPMPEFLP